MSITEKTKQKIIDYINDKGHVINDCNTTVKSCHWVIECGQCSGENRITINNLSTTVNNRGDVMCVHCKFATKINKFLLKSETVLLRDVEFGDVEASLGCIECGLSYQYRGDFQDNFKCYCRMVIKRTEHDLYKWLTMIFDGSGAILSKEAKVFGNHKVDIKVQIDEKTFYLEVDDPGHFNPRTTQGLSDIANVKEFLEDDVENAYLIHINEDDVYKPKTLRILYKWMNNHLDDNPEEKLLLLDSSGKNRYNYLNLPEIGKYLKFNEKKI